MCDQVVPVVTINCQLMQTQLSLCHVHVIYSTIHPLYRNVLLRLFLKLRRSAWAEGSYSSGPPAGGISQILNFETLRQSG